MQTTNTIPASSRFGQAWLKGRIVGALVCGSFGAVWMLEAMYFGRIGTPAGLTIISILAVVFIVWPVTRLRSFPRVLHVPVDGQRWSSISKTFWTIAAVEWSLCAVSANRLAHIHRYHLIPVFLGVIIGVHFLPLARLFKMPIYYATGAVMMLGVLATLALPAGEIRNIAAYGINGVALWGTAVVILCQDWLSSIEMEGIPLAH